MTSRVATQKARIRELDAITVTLRNRVKSLAIDLQAAVEAKKRQEVLNRSLLSKLDKAKKRIDELETANRVVEHDLDVIKDIIREHTHEINQDYDLIRTTLPDKLPDYINGRHTGYLPTRILAGLFTTDFDATFGIHDDGNAWFEQIPGVGYSPVDILNGGGVGFLWPVNAEFEDEHLYFPRWLTRTYDASPPEPGYHRSGLMEMIERMRYTTNWQYGETAFRPLMANAFSSLELRLTAIFHLLDRCMSMVQEVDPYVEPL